MRKLTLITGLTAGLAFATAQAEIKIVTEEGNTVETQLSAGIAVNKGATLKRIDHMLVDSAMPAKCGNGFGISTIYKSGGRTSSGGYLYTGLCNLEAREALDAYEIRFIVFDAFGNRVRTLSASAITPIAASGELTLDPVWNVYSENEVSMHQMSIAYVSQLRLANGKIVKANPKEIAAAISKLVPQFDESGLQVKAPTKGE